jgi:hypothetical protein
VGRPTGEDRRPTRREPAIAPAGEGPPRWARGFVACFLALFVVAALAGTDTWPFTGLRLFSRARTQEAVSYRALALDARGRARPVRFGALGAGFGGFALVAGTLEGRPPTERVAVCRTWARAAGRTVPRITRLRVERVVTDLGVRRGDRAAPGVASELVSCDAPD